jgi:GNAT superfamily N-acetyltransferase
VRFFRPVPRVSLAQPDDAPALAELYRRVWDGLCGVVGDRLREDQSPPAEDVAAWLRGGFEVYRASMEGGLVGAVRCSFPTAACLVDRLAVEQAFRRRGVGRYLVEHAISRARRAGVTRVWIFGSEKLPEAMHLFREVGFVPVARHRASYWGEDLVLMELPL